MKFIDPKIREVKGSIWANRVKNKGKDLRIRGDGFISGVDNLHIGDHCRILPGFFLSCDGGLTIGDNSHLSRNALIYTNTHTYDSSANAIPIDGSSYVNKPVIIGNSVWVGMNVTIAPGTIIEDGAIIGMGTLVSGHIPKGAIVVSPKARIVGYRDMVDFEKKKIEKKYWGLLFPDR